LFTALEPLLAISLACMPLLRPFGEKVANSSAISWVKSITSSMSASRGTSLHSVEKGKASSESSSMDNYPLHPDVPYYKAGGDIMVTSEVDQQSSRLSGGSGRV
jgi:hypothetical protein